MGDKMAENLLIIKANLTKLDLAPIKLNNESIIVDWEDSDSDKSLTEADSNDSDLEFL